MKKQKSYKRLRSCTCVVLSLCFMLLTSLSVRSVESSLKGTGTKENPYKISTYADLKEFSERVNKGDPTACARLTKNIVCKNDPNDTDYATDWVPIGSDYSHQYTGTFDGQGHSIAGLSTPSDCTANCVGLFGYVGNGGTVENVALIGGSINGISSIGAVAGHNGGTVQSCHNTGKVNGFWDVGGVVGHNIGTVQTCYNTGSLIGKEDNVGGVAGSNNVGGVAGSNEGTIQNCYNTGSVTGTHDYVGGVAGYNYDTVKICYNTGKVIGRDHVGGVVGENQVTNNSGGPAEAQVTNCYNTGDVTGTAEDRDAKIGGVVGSNCATSFSGTVTAQITNCYNTGNVIGTAATNAQVGGVVGQNQVSDSGDTAKAQVTNCYNTGKVTVAATNTDKVGGVIGYNRAAHTYATEIAQIANCYYDKNKCTITTAIGANLLGSIDNVIGLTTDQMTGKDALSKMLGFSDDIWMTKKSDTNYDYYPHLKDFSSDKYWPPKLEKNDSGTWDQTTDPAQKSTDENNNADIVDPSLNGDAENNKSSSDTSYTGDGHTYKTADTVTASGLIALELLMMLALMGLYVSLKKKKI